MKISKKLKSHEIAAVVVEHLNSKGIDLVMVGGAVVSYYTNNEYQSRDIDFVSPDDHREIIQAMLELGFQREGKDFVHPQSLFSVEFPSGPLGIGEESPIKAEGEISVGNTKVKLYSPTQSVMDRLAHFYHWKDRQCLDQAVMIYKVQNVNLKKIKQWSEREGQLENFEIFLKRINDK